MAKETTVQPEIRVPITLPLLEEESVGRVDQTVNICRNGEILRIQRGEHVEVPLWAFEILKQSGKYPNI